MTSTEETGSASSGLRLAIVGSRKFPNQHLALKLIKRNLTAGMTLVSGGAEGPDAWAEEYADASAIPKLIFKPDWSKGKHAGMLRNSDIVANADVVFAFWDGSSKGTKDTIDKAMAARVDLVVVRPDGKFTRIGFGDCTVNQEG